jgi:hypothetical protein
MALMCCRHGTHVLIDINAVNSNAYFFKIMLELYAICSEAIGILSYLQILKIAVGIFQLYNDAGVPTKQFVGVPVFQAEGLTVTTQEMVCQMCHTLCYRCREKCDLISISLMLRSVIVFISTPCISIFPLVAAAICPAVPG